MVEYTNSQIKELIQEYIHNEDDRKMLFLRLVQGKTFEQIGGIVKKDVKTVRSGFTQANQSCLHTSPADAGDLLFCGLWRNKPHNFSFWVLYFI